MIPKYVVTVKALIIKDGKILTIKKLRDNKIDFSLPGGIVEENETLEEALKREVMEEIGADIEIKMVIYAKKYKHPYGDWNVAIYYLCEPKSLNFKLSEGEVDQKFLEIVWIDENCPEIPDWLKDLIIKIKETIRSA